MDLEKINMQMMMEDIFNSCKIGEVFEDRDELKEFRSELYRFINLLDEYERDNFDRENEVECDHLEYEKYTHNGQKYARCYDCNEVFKIK